MEKGILESIVSLTAKQDIDSLELSLLTSVIELLNCNRAAIYEVDILDEKNINAALLVEKKTDSEEYQWLSDTPVESVNKELLTAIQQKRKTRVDDTDGRLYLWLPILGAGKPVCLYIECRDLNAEQGHFVEAIVRIYGNYLSILVESERDKLTGLLNRHSFDRRLKQILARQRREQDLITPNQKHSRREVSKKNAWLAMIDIDYFKRVNDKYGHVCGDEVLLSLAQKMQGFFRKSDVMFRFGGEEFVLILAPSRHDDAYFKLDAFRATIEDSTFPLADKLTVSIGYTAITDEYQQLIIERADKSLYYAKEHGRNQVHCYETLLANNLLSSNETDEQTEIDLF